MTNIYVTQELEVIGIKRRVNWLWLIMLKLKIFNWVLIFMATKKVPHTRFHFLNLLIYFAPLWLLIVWLGLDLKTFLDASISW